MVRPVFGDQPSRAPIMSDRSCAVASGVGAFETLDGGRMPPNLDEHCRASVVYRRVEKAGKSAALLLRLIVQMSIRVRLDRHERAPRY
jgi:hypothetical protein